MNTVYIEFLCKIHNVRSNDLPLNLDSTMATNMARDGYLEAGTLKLTKKALFYITEGLEKVPNPIETYVFPSVGEGK